MASNLWNTTIDDTSSLFRYYPYSDGVGLANGWQVGYTGSGSSASAGQVGAGDSFHATSLFEATVSLTFFGNGIALYGSANSSYEITLDNTFLTAVTPSNDVLFSQYGLTSGSHIVSITTRPVIGSNQVVSLDRAVISSNPDADASNTEPVQIQLGNRDGTISYNGDWAVKSDTQIPSTSNPSPYHTSTNKGDSASLAFRGRSVAIHGATNPSSGLFSVTLDNHTQALNGSTFWLVPDTLLFFQDGLDETVDHHIKITNGAQDSSLSLNSFIVFGYKSPMALSGKSSSGGTSGSSGSKSIIGPIIGAVLGSLAILLLGLFLIWRYKKRHQTSHRTSATKLPFDVEPFNMGNMSPTKPERAYHYGDNPLAPESKDTLKADSLRLDYLHPARPPFASFDSVRGTPSERSSIMGGVTGNTAGYLPRGSDDYLLSNSRTASTGNVAAIGHSGNEEESGSKRQSRLRDVDGFGSASGSKLDENDFLGKVLHRLSDHAVGEAGVIHYEDRPPSYPPSPLSQQQR